MGGVVSKVTVIKCSCIQIRSRLLRHTNSMYSSVGVDSVIFDKQELPTVHAHGGRSAPQADRSIRNSAVRNPEVEDYLVGSQVHKPDTLSSQCCTEHTTHVAHNICRCNQRPYEHCVGLEKLIQRQIVSHQSKAHKPESITHNSAQHLNQTTKHNTQQCSVSQSNQRAKHTTVHSRPLFSLQVE